MGLARARFLSNENLVQIKFPTKTKTKTKTICGAKMDLNGK
jgi:hypothetical protein